MNISKFFANTSRQALQLVRQALGPDALILSNRPLDGGVEILAMAQHEMPQLQAGAQADKAAAPSEPRHPGAGRDPGSAPAPEAATPWTPAYAGVTGRAGGAGRDPGAALTETRRPGAGRDPGSAPDVPKLWTPAYAGVTGRPTGQPRHQADGLAPSLAAAPQPSVKVIDSELKSIRRLIEDHLGYQAFDLAQRRDPGKSKVLRGMLQAGFSAALARQFIAKMPEDLGTQQKIDWVKAGLERNLRTVSPQDEIVERGGVYALVGPTGVGKTTTVAKIAARCVVRFGADRLALLSTDGYRIGAQEQLRIYGKLLGVRVIAVKDATDLQFVLQDLRGKHLVLIDTVGMGQRDQLVAEQLAMLGAPDAAVQRLLLLNATGHGETLDDVVRVYGQGVQGCIISKTDEAVGIATALDVAIRHQLRLHYITDGQRVPEDLHLPDRAQLLAHALHPVGAATAHHLNEDESGLLLATAPASRAAQELSFA